jgi:lipoprotein-anchoring transpeptidase ErfK/SrfK
MKLSGLAILMAAGAVQALAQGPVRQIIVSIPDRKLVLVEDGHVKKVYPIAVGKASTPSPAGTFHIASRVVNPTWYGPHIIVPPGKSNPLGTRWMGLGYKGYGIHGTNAPKSIGKAASHGCIRMRVKDAEELFQLVTVGDEVQLHAQRDDVIAKVLPETKAPESMTAAPVIAASTAEPHATIAGGGQ